MSSTIFRLTGILPSDPVSQRIDIDCWNEIVSFLTYQDVRKALEVESIFRSDAHSYLNVKVIQERFEDVLLKACDFLTVGDIGNCVLAFAQDNIRLALKLSQKSELVKKRPRRRRPPAACPCCFPRDY
jgi:hypothetical protein